MTKPLLPPLLSGGQVLAETNGCLGLIILNRPESLNALSLAMVRDITHLLLHWQSDPRIQAVALMAKHRVGKSAAFCAGGDLRFFHQAALAGDPQLDDFFTEEYGLVHLIHQYTKPCIALMDGIVMGGGMGLTQGCKLRVVNEHSRLAMPETRIGLFPDVGGSFFLGQCPGSVGEWLALTGQAVGAGDAIAWGLADVFVPATAWPDLIETLRHRPQQHAEHVVATIMERVELAPEAQLTQFRQQIDDCFSAPDLQQILERLKEEGSDWAQSCLVQMSAHSPRAMALTLRLLCEARHLDLADALRLERDLMYACFAPAAQARPCEAIEGIRARIIDKDDAPGWQESLFDLAGIAAHVETSFKSPWTAEAHPLRYLV